MTQAASLQANFNTLSEQYDLLKEALDEFKVPKTVSSILILIDSVITAIEENFIKLPEDSTMSYLRNTPKFASLTKENYNAWSFQMKSYLQLADPCLWLDLTEKDLSADKKKTATIAYHIIVQNVDGEHAEFLQNCSSLTGENSVKALLALQEKFKGSKFQRQQILMTRLYALKHHEGESVLQHLTNYESIYNELASIGKTFDELEKVICLANSIQSSYGQAIQAYSAAHRENVTFLQAIAVLKDEELRRSSQAFVAAPAMVSMSTPRRHMNPSQHKMLAELKNMTKRQRVEVYGTCKNPDCGIVGHPKELCFKLYPYLAPQKLRSFNRVNFNRKRAALANVGEPGDGDFGSSASFSSRDVSHPIYGMATRFRQSGIHRLHEQSHSGHAMIKSREVLSTSSSQLFENRLEDRISFNRRSLLSRIDLHGGQSSSTVNPMNGASNMSDEMMETEFDDEIIDCCISNNEIEDLNSYHFVFNCSVDISQFKSSEWIIDSGASIHMTHNRSLFKDIVPKGGFICVANGEKANIEGVGLVILKFKTPTGAFTLELKNVLLVPSLSINLISCNELNRDNIFVLFKNHKCFLSFQHNWLEVSHGQNGNFVLNEVLEKANVCVHDWHNRMAHRNLSDILSLKRLGLDISKCNCSDQCQACEMAKMPRASFERSKKPSNPLDLIVADLVGPFPVRSLTGSHYYLAMTDIGSDYTEVYFLKQKSEASKYITEFLQFLHNQLGKFPKIFRSDGGGEFDNAQLNSFLASHGIKIERTVPYTPESNGYAERRNRTINDAGRANLLASGMSEMFWEEAIIHAVYTQNRLTRQGKSSPPVELLFGKLATASFIPFGAQVYIPTIQQGRHKLDKRAVLARFLNVDGYAKGFRVWVDGKIVVTRTVKEKQANTFEEIQQQLLAEDNMSSPCEVLHPQQDELQILHPEPRRSERLKLKEKVPFSRRVHLTMSASKSSENRDVFEIPNTYNQAMKSANKSNWELAMQEELNSLKQNDSYDVVDLPAGRKAIGNRWVYTTKMSDGNLRFKARLVAQGFTQEFGVDFDQVYAPVARPPSTRLFLSTASKYKLVVKQFDVKTAFLNGKLDEEIYMQQPQGFVLNEKVLRLKKAIYGLKQAAKCWNDIVKEALSTAGFTPSQADDCLYSNNKSLENLCLVIFHVDDFLIASKHDKIIQETAKLMNTKFELKEIGFLKQFLGVDYMLNEDGIYCVYQTNHINKMLAKLGLSDTKGQKYPLDPGYHKLEDDRFLPTNGEFRKIIGMLLYISCNSRPDISISVNILAQRVTKPRVIDMQEALRVAKYLASTKHLALKLYNPDVDQNLFAYCDADHGENKIDGKSNSGVMIFVNGALMSWSSRKQTLVALSTCDAELYAINEAVKDILWFKSVLPTFKIDSTEPTKINSDSQAAIDMIKNNNYRDKAKYIRLRGQHVHDYLQKLQISLNKVSSEDNLADLLTKPLNGVKLKSLRERSGMFLIENKNEIVLFNQFVQTDNKSIQSTELDEDQLMDIILQEGLHSVN